jgi:hypothetical protein
VATTTCTSFSTKTSLHLWGASSSLSRIPVGQERGRGRAIKMRRLYTTQGLRGKRLLRPVVLDTVPAFQCVFVMTIRTAHTEKLLCKWYHTINSTHIG